MHVEGWTYTRWGHNACPGTQMLYTGRMSGVYYNQKWGGANYLCLPNNPSKVHSTHTPRIITPIKISGTKYEHLTQNTNIRLLVVMTTMYRVLFAMLRQEQLKWWFLLRPDALQLDKRLLYSYLESEVNGSDGQCMDKAQLVSLYGSQADIDGALLHHVSAECKGIQCPPYNY